MYNVNYKSNKSTSMIFKLQKNFKEPKQQCRYSIIGDQGLTPQFHGIVLHTDLLTFLLTYFSKIMSFKNISPHGEIFLI